MRSGVIFTGFALQRSPLLPLASFDATVPSGRRKFNTAVAGRFRLHFGRRALT